MAKTRKHRGGATYAYTGTAGVSAGGVPYESRVSIQDHCMSQRGGSCGCGQRQLGGSGGSGGYSFDFGNNALGKVYAALPIGACPKQLGGSSEREISSSRAGYGFGPAGVVSTESAHYVDPTHFKGGARKSKKSKKSKKSRSRK
jgi:hypothetical protein